MKLYCLVMDQPSARTKFTQVRLLKAVCAPALCRKAVALFWSLYQRWLVGGPRRRCAAEATEVTTLVEVGAHAILFLDGWDNAAVWASS